MQVFGLKVHPPTEVPSGKQKQDLVVADKTGCVNLACGKNRWENLTIVTNLLASTSFPIQKMEYFC